MPFWRPEPLTSEIERDGNPRLRSSIRIGSNDSCRMNASIFFTDRNLLRWWRREASHATGTAPGAGLYADELGRRDELLRVPVHAVLGDVQSGVLLLGRDAQAVPSP